jgi:hypothetical protein
MRSKALSKESIPWNAAKRLWSEATIRGTAEGRGWEKSGVPAYRVVQLVKETLLGDPASAEATRAKEFFEFVATCARRKATRRIIVALATDDVERQDRGPDWMEEIMTRAATLSDERIKGGTDR